jgi:uncharacterized membrane protein YccC
VQFKATIPAEAAAAARWRPDDPDLASLRRAARVALVMPPLFALSVVVAHNAQVTTFVAFGCFALMVLADLGGLRAPRAAAYVVTTLLGAVMVAIGTLASPVAWLAALAMLVVAFWIQLMGLFGGYAAAAQPALLLSFVLAVSIPGTPSDVGPRLAGWLIAGLVSTLAAVFLWPRFERLNLQKKAARATRALAELFRKEREGDLETEVPGARREAEGAVREATQEYSATAKRPAGPTRRDRALVELLNDLERTLEFMERLFPSPTGVAAPAISPETERLASNVAGTLSASADVLTGGPPPDLVALDEARTDHRRGLDAWAAGALREGQAPEAVVEGLDAAHGLRVLSYLALAVGSNAMVAAGGQPETDLLLPAGTPREGAARVLLRVGRALRAHLTPTSSVLHNAVRSAIGLALAVFLARVLRLDHAFWVVLGATSVLRTNALATGRTTLEAILGTLAGFVVGAIFTATLGRQAAVLWAALPVVVFFAAYASNVIGFLVGQSAFTVMVMILFNLITPAGWQLGLVRIEDVALGAGISVVVGLLLWPRGARRELSRSVASFYRAVAAYLESSFTRVVEGTPSQSVRRDRLSAVLARDRAQEALEQFLNERAVKHIEPETAALLLSLGAHALLVGDILNVLADMGYEGGGCPRAVEALRVQTHASLSALKRLADQLDQAAAAAGLPSTGHEELVREAALGCLRRWKKDPRVGRSAIAVVAADVWLQHLGTLTAEMEKPVARASSAARVPWWR